MKNTFSYDVKHEILDIRYDASCCAVASLCAIFETLGEVVVKRGGFTLSLAIDHDDMFEFVVATIEKFYGKLDDKMNIFETQHMGNVRREIVFDEALGKQLLFDTGIVSLENGSLHINGELERTLFAEDCCKIAFLSHAFAAAGSISLPSESSGYHMEWALSKKLMAEEIMNLLAEFEVFAKLIKRGDKWIVYLKDRDVIEELVGRFGAGKSMLRLAEMSLEKDLRNKINRGANCASANISKTVDASAKQLAAIGIICDTIGLDALSPSLKAAALARKEDQSASLAALAKKLGISKSAIRARFDSIIALSESLR